MKPNKPETAILKLCYDLPIKYVGDGSFYVGNKNPDFRVIGQQKVIEYFGIYCHGQKARKPEEMEPGKIAYFRKHGYECLVIWENELKNKTKVRQRIQKFVKIKKRRGKK